MPDKTDKIIAKLLNLEADLKFVKKNMATKKELGDITSNLDKFMKQVDSYYKEMLSLKNKVDRLEKWVNLIAKKVGIQLET